jgi:hypothetical protein
MNDIFERRVRAAAVAGWWALLWAVGFLTVVWLAFLSIMSTRPEWMLTILGPKIGWDYIQLVTIWAVAIFKLFIWGLAVIVLWLTLWARQLRKPVN